MSRCSNSSASARLEASAGRRDPGFDRDFDFDSESMHVLLTTDAFPPICGGSGWSTFELARGLRALGHRVSIVRPRPGEPAGVRLATYDGFTVHELGSFAPRVPYLRNYFKNERLAPQLAGWLRGFMREQAVDIVHAQHVLSTPGSIDAVLSAPAPRRVPIVCTVRDYWPVCYWSDLIHDYQAPTLCPGCSASMMTRCVRPRAGALWPVTLPLIPYMRRNLHWKRDMLSRADAVIAVSSTIAHDLRTRAPELTRAGTRLEIIPNPVDMRALRETAATLPSSSAAAMGTGTAVTTAATGAGLAGLPPRPYAIYVGKLAPNKGTAKLMTAVTRANLTWPLVIVGDGPDRAEVEVAARASGRDVRFTGWLARDEALRWLAQASLLIFPSHGPESLSRVLLEASALGVPAAAMNTGGTRDIITHEQTGLLSTSPEELGDHIARLAHDEALRIRLGTAARAHVDANFDARAVVGRIETLYNTLRRARAESNGASTEATGASKEADATDEPAPEAARTHA
jgi:glycogen(starch) synthase